MALPNYSHSYEQWAPVVGRVLFGLLFLLGASFKIPGTAGFAGEAGMTAAAGLPYAAIFVGLAFLLEVVCGVSLIIGWHVRTAAFVLAIFTLALAIIFYNDFSNPEVMGMFVSHLGLIAGLLYISVYGAQHAAAKRDPLPRS